MFFHKDSLTGKGSSSSCIAYVDRRKYSFFTFGKKFDRFLFLKSLFGIDSTNDQVDERLK